MPQMIIANRLVDGVVVFFGGRQAAWVEAIENGVVIEDEADTERLLALAKMDEEHCIVIDPYPIEVTTEGDRPRPAVYREAIRAFGPTVRTELLESNNE